MPPIPVPKVDGLHAFLSVAACAFGMLWLNARSATARAVELRQKAEKALRELKEQPERAEFRIERFELLWFPVVTASIQHMEITSVNPGVPHCAKCAVPLGLSGKDWVCANCGSRHPESIADTMVLDSISDLALKYFKERRPGYRVLIKGRKTTS